MALVFLAAAIGWIVPCSQPGSADSLKEEGVDDRHFKLLAALPHATRYLTIENFDPSQGGSVDDKHFKVLVVLPHAAQYLTIENFDPEAEADDSRPYTIRAGVNGFRIVIGPYATYVMARRAAESLFPSRQADEIEPT